MASHGLAVQCANMAEQIEVMLGMETLGDPRNNVGVMISMWLLQNYFGQFEIKSVL